MAAGLRIAGAGLLCLLALPGLAADPGTAAIEVVERERAERMDWLRTVESSHSLLGISPARAARSKLPLQFPAPRVVPTDLGNGGLRHLLSPATGRNLVRLFRAAERDDIGLHLVSGYRSVIYQASLIERRVANGVSLDRVLKGTALPGYSEHHTGCAVDLASDDYPQVGQRFRETAAYDWLRENADRHGFRESYPPGNGAGLISEPWHWYYEDCERGGW